MHWLQLNSPNSLRHCNCQIELKAKGGQILVWQYEMKYILKTSYFYACFHALLRKYWSGRCCHQFGPSTQQKSPSIDHYLNTPVTHYSGLWIPSCLTYIAKHRKISAQKSECFVFVLIFRFSFKKCNHPWVLSRITYPLQNSVPQRPYNPIIFSCYLRW